MDSNSNDLIACAGCHRLFYPAADETVCLECAPAYRHGGAVWKLWQLVPFDTDETGAMKLRAVLLALGNALVDIIDAAEKQRGLRREYGVASEELQRKESDDVGQ